MEDNAIIIQIIDIINGILVTVSMVYGARIVKMVILLLFDFKPDISSSQKIYPSSYA